MPEIEGEKDGLIGNAASGQSLAPTEVKDIAARAYIYAYPLVLLEETRGAAPVNILNHVRVFPPAGFRLIVRPNADTLYSMAWIDVSSEPVLIHVPDSGGRFYLLQFMDAWTETFANPGKRTTGTAEAWFAIVGRDWSGKLPEHVIRLDAPTDFVWLLGRTQTNGVDDYDNVHAFQNGMRLIPLSAYLKQDQDPGSAPAYRPPSGTPPPERVKSMNPTEFFAAFAESMKANPPHEADTPIVQDLAKSV